MIEIMGIISGGKFHNTVKLLNQTIECPECGTVGYHTDKIFNTAVDGETFIITCNNCGCKFRIKTKNERRGVMR